ncbi:hypothetical protein GDO78_001347 [Eleutherodactylus coqui]|uniref:Uncharacterized protein n=1 Tax=Eleutherodactylus coqui TaxID=57060 RepID=A0A8J6KGV1_ELECQ|nr:hypothetical protein GDO78_001347 [Eleutherodactylus coqui]
MIQKAVNSISDFCTLGPFCIILYLILEHSSNVKAAQRDVKIMMALTLTCVFSSFLGISALYAISITYSYTITVYVPLCHNLRLLVISLLRFLLPWK